MPSFDRLINLVYRELGTRKFDGSYARGDVIWTRDLWARLESNRYYTLAGTGGTFLRTEVDYSIRYLAEVIADPRRVEVIDENGVAVNLTAVSEPDGTRRRFLLLTTER